MSKFENGKTYSTRSICDAACIFSITVVRRTAKTIRASIDGTEKTLRITERDGVECVMPLGSYSMAPTIRAA